MGGFPRRDYNIKSHLTRRVPETPAEAANGRYYRADVVDSTQTCFKNYGGYIRSDIEMINDQQSLEVAQALAQRLIQRPSDGVTDDNVKDTDLVLSLKSRYRQTPSEVIGYIENRLEERDAKIEDTVLDKQEEKTVAEKKSLLKRIRESLTSQENDLFIQKKRERDIQKLVDEDEE